jgi:hypothetical protein
MSKSLLAIFIFSAAGTGIGSSQATVLVRPANLQGPRALQKQTASAAIQYYLQSWQRLRVAMEQNRVDALEPAFIGTAKDKLTETILQQERLGIHTSYQDRAHDLQLVF